MLRIGRAGSRKGRGLISQKRFIKKVEIHLDGGCGGLLTFDPFPCGEALFFESYFVRLSGPRIINSLQNMVRL